MATRNDAKTPSSPPIPPAPASTPNKHRGLYAYTSVTGIALIAIGCVLYSINTSMQSTERQAKRLLTQITTLKQQQIDTRTLFNTSINVINESQHKLKNQLNAVEKQLQSTLQQPLYQAKDWLFLKARYYLELAQINAQWSNNWQTTSALLQHADELLADIHDQRLFKIRQAIAKEITALQAVPKIDMPGILSQLDAALSTVTSLPLKPTVAPAAKNTATGTNDTSSSTWRKRLKESVSLLEELVVVRHHEEDIHPLPSPTYEAMLRESIRLYLQEAQWAVLQNNEPVYLFSLTQAIKNINHSFAADAAETIALIEQLHALQQIYLVQQKPILDQSLPLLNQLIESKNTPASDVKPTARGVTL